MVHVERAVVQLTTRPESLETHVVYPDSESIAPRQIEGFIQFITEGQKEKQ